LKPKKLIVAFETQLVPGVPAPKFVPPANYKDQTKIEAWLEKKQTEYAATAANQPYTGTFKRLIIADPANERVLNLTYRKPGGDQQPVCLAARSWLLKEYPDAWEHSTNSRREPEVIFIGFRTRLFLKMLGIECSMPANQPEEADQSNALPLGMWYGNSDHRDLEEACMPRGFELDLNQVLHMRGITVKQSWRGVGSDAKGDLSVATELAAQLGMLSELTTEEE
jgi:hypothetical protein